MAFTDPFIRRPVLATVVSLLIVLLGMQAFSRLVIREYPQMENALITVTTFYAGANAETIQGYITQPLQQSLASAEGIDYMTSVSRQNYSVISIYAHIGANTDRLVTELLSKIGEVKTQLPPDAEDPVLDKEAADASALMYISFYSEHMDNPQITDYLSRVIQPKLATLPGIAEAEILGNQVFAMRLWLDPVKMAAYGITASDIDDAVRKYNFLSAAGEVKGELVVTSVNAATDLKSPQAFAAIPLKTLGDRRVLMSDVARVELGAASYDSVSSFNGIPSVYIGIKGTPSSNPLDVIKEVRAKMPELEEQLPPDLKVSIAYDATRFIQASIDEVVKTLGEAILIVIVVVFLFLGAFRSVLIPVVTIPLSMIGVLFFMQLMGYSINLLTLLAMVLAIGLVVDDAIVMLENIYRHIEEGLDPFSAAIKGAREIGFAIVAMTLTLVAVYAPLAFTPGRTGRLFVEFALALAGAVVVSGFVALTLSPMMCSLLLKHNPKPNWFDRSMERWLTALSDAYGRLLRWIVTARWGGTGSGRGGVRGALFQARWIVLGVMALSGAALVLVFPSMRQELSPLEDRGTILASVTAPDGATLDYTNRYALELEKIGNTYPEFDRVFANIGNPTVAQGSVIYRTVDWEKRDRTTLALAKELQPKVAGLPGVNAFLITPPSLGQGFRSRPLTYVIQTSDSYENLSKVVAAFMAEIAQNPGIVSPDVDLRLNKPELRIEVNRERAADLGVSVEVVAKAIETMLGGRTVTRYKRDAEQYDVIVQTEARGRTTPENIDTIYVRGRNDAMIPLTSLVNVRESVSPRELNHFGQRRSATITANLSSDYSLGQAITFMNETAAKVLKPGYTTDLNDTSREFKNSQGALGVVFVLALVFIFLVLAAQFESFIDPLVIMVSVPLSMIGALLALKWSGGSLNVYSQIGLITLVGLITKHGILIVEFTNQLREEGMEMVEALVKASAQRLRPILMTTGAMVLGAIPLALATGAGAETRTQIGWVIVGGMSLGTLLTIFVVPTMYTLFARKAVPGANTAVAVDAPTHPLHPHDYVAK